VRCSPIEVYFGKCVDKTSSQRVAHSNIQFYDRKLVQAQGPPLPLGPRGNKNRAGGGKDNVNWDLNLALCCIIRFFRGTSNWEVSVFFYCKYFTEFGIDLLPEKGRKGTTSQAGFLVCGILTLSLAGERVTVEMRVGFWGGNNRRNIGPSRLDLHGV